MKTFSRYCLKVLFFKSVLLIFLSFTVLQSYSNPKIEDKLEAGFKDPPRARSHVYGGTG